MCGIVGIFGESNLATDWIQRATYSLKHRGPDDYGIQNLNNGSLGMTRLAIIDIKGGAQPFMSENKQYTIVFNGQIYNFNEIREALASKGIVFQTTSDTEVILYGYIVFGEKILERLEGMFAFAIWDSVKEELLLARDKFGEKPLVYHVFENGGVAFASEIKALLLHPKISRDPNFVALRTMMNFGYIPSPYSAYKGILKLPPGHFLIWNKREIHVSQYWRISPVKKKNPVKSELIEELDSILNNAVKQRLQSERKVGAWLSGGVDSSLVAHYMAQNCNQPIETFSAGFSEREYDESEYSKIVANSLGASHNLIMLDSGIDEIMAQISLRLDEPFADSSFLATYMLSGFTKPICSVVLGGDGGDEVFGGYERYRLMSLVGDSGINLQTLKILSKFIAIIPLEIGLKSKIAKRKALLDSDTDPFAFYENMMTWIKRTNIDNLLKQELQDSEIIDFKQFLDQSHHSSRKIEFMANLFDLHSYLPGDLLTKVDMASMSFGLEVRSPFLDSRVVNFGLSLPEKFRIQPTRTKILLKDLARKKVPIEIVDRPKQGFGIPRSKWLRGELNRDLHSILSKSNANFSNIINMTQVEERLRKFDSGDNDDTEIWALYMLGNWAKAWL